MDLDVLIAVLRALNARDVAYKIVGGVALNALGIARATEDLDIFIAPTAENVARLRLALHDVFQDPCIDEISTADLLGDYPAVQYIPPDGRLRLDILTRLGEAFSFADVETAPVPVLGVPAPVATPRMLYRMKHATVRPRDRADAERLRALFDLDEQP